MLRYFFFILAFSLALGNLVDLVLPSILEVLILCICSGIIVQKKYFNRILLYARQAIPLFVISFFLLVANYYYDQVIIGEIQFNYKFLMVIGFFILASAYFNENKINVTSCLLAFALGAAVLSVLYYFNLLSEYSVVRNSRLLILGENPNSLSVRVAIGVHIIIWIALDKQRRLFLKLILLVLLPFMLLLIVESGSKGSFLATALGVLMVIVMSKRISKRFKIFSFLVMFIGFFASLDFLLASNLFERFENSTLTTGRIVIWKEAFEIFKSNLLGIGEFGYKQEIENRLGVLLDTHNLFLYLLVAGGLPSLVLFLFFYIKLFYKATFIFNWYNESFYIILWLVMFFIMNKTGGVLTYFVMWYFLAIINAQTIRIRRINL